MLGHQPMGKRSNYTLQEAEQDFGPCGKILYMLKQTKEPADMDVNLLFGLEACWSQHTCKLDKNQQRHVEMMRPVFHVSPSVMPPYARKARENAQEINWVEKVKQMKV